MFLPSNFHPLSTCEDRLAEQRAILTRAAEQEARRQRAAAGGDLATMREAEAELRRLWRRFVELDGG